MSISSLSDNQQLTLLKNAYFEALASYNDSYTEEALSKLSSSEDAYMSYIECSVSQA
ncbi:hypothetical protein [Methylotenera versatilis]|uniref:Uncharacterized protein n=1 Tax=Methylotenera versatilis (strain 301) TaxID=666681 RepID=D7DJH3_METV0|nr:hypothetical protein [Methylotenera versatilis]ADI30208.1 hypothetical protein M301_1834 [Methylotenera versatilis 301]